MSPYVGCSSSPSCSNSFRKSYRQGLRGPASFLQYLFLFLSSSPHRVFSSVLFLLLFAFAATASAQTTPTANDDGSYSVPYDWALKPSGFSGGERFRLLFITSTQRDATATSIATYNSFVQGRASAGHSAIQTYSAEFKVVGSTSTVDARDNTGTTGRGVPIYWLNGAKVADNYPDFYDGNWDGSHYTQEDGLGREILFNTTAWTGSNSDGTKHSFPLGHAQYVMVGNVSLKPLNQAAEVSTANDNFYGLSPVFVVTPPPDVSVHPADAIGREGDNGTASVELRLSRALESGETLTVDYSIDLNTGVSESHNGVSLSHNAGSTSTGTVTITGPNAPQNIQLSLSPANNTVNKWERARPTSPGLSVRWVTGIETADFRLTGVSGVAGASLSGTTSAKLFVNDSAVSRTTSIQVSGWSTLDSRYVEEGGEVWILLDGKAGNKRNSGPRLYDWYNVEIGVQNLTTDFNDLGEAYRGHDAFVGHLRRDGDTDYYNVGVLGYGYPAQMRIPIQSDGTREGDERFRVFISETVSYMGVGGTYNSLYSAPGIDFTIKDKSGSPRRSPSQQPEPPPVPTQAVSNIQVTAVDTDNAKVTWDAVEHATSYELEWEGVSIAGINADITGTTSTIDHYAPEPMTLTITVIPQYIDENGDTQHLNDLAGTAVFNVGGQGSQSSDVQDSIQSQDGNNQQLEENCDLDEVQSDVEGYVLETYNGDAHVARWQRVLNAFAGNDGGMSGVEARFMETLFSANRWEPVAEGIECLEAARGKDNTYAELIAKMYEWRYDTRYVSYKSHTNRWDRALLAFGESVSDSSLEPMTAADAQVFADRGWSRWVEVARALWEIE